MTGPLQVSSSLPSSVPFLWSILLVSDEQVAGAHVVCGTEHGLPSAPLPRGGAHAAPFRIAKAGFPPLLTLVGAEQAGSSEEFTKDSHCT